VGALNADELNTSTEAIIRIAQQQDFACEIKKLKQAQPIYKQSNY